VVVLNKSYTQAADFNIQIAGLVAYGTASVYAFDSTSSTITQRTAATLANNQVTYTLAPKTAAHFVFRPSGFQTPSLPVFTAEPVSQAVANGSTVVFSASATGGAANIYQWLWNGVPFNAPETGVATATLVINNANLGEEGVFTCEAVNLSGGTTSSPATLTVVSTANPGRLTNLSCRAQVGTGTHIMTAGFVIGGAGVSGEQSVLVRGTGPTLSLFNLTGLLPDPKLTLNNTTAGTVIDTDTGWGGNAAIAAEAAKLGAFSWGASATPDSALLESLPPDNYTAQIAGASGDTGLALVEVYDATPASTYAPATPRMTNLSALIQVGSGANVVFAGFVIGGTTAKTVLIRASGPTLATAFGLTGVLNDPQLTLTSTSVTPSQVILVNTGWGGDATIAAQAKGVGAFAWSDSSADSAILITLPPGNYTAGVAGASGDTGLSLIELYEVP
jgi:hypothetical protein